MCFVFFTTNIANCYLVSLLQINHRHFLNVCTFENGYLNNYGMTCNTRLCVMVISFSSRRSNRYEGCLRLFLPCSQRMKPYLVQNCHDTLLKIT